MFPAIMPWPITLAPTSEAVRRENCARKKTLIQKKNNRHSPGVHERCKDSITIKEAYDFVRVGESNRTYGHVAYICLIYRISSVNGCTLRILSCSVLVPC
jgi:hypothetical protein